MQGLDCKEWGLAHLLERSRAPLQKQHLPQCVCSAVGMVKPETLHPTHEERERGAYRGTSLIQNRNPPNTVMGPYA